MVSSELRGEMNGTMEENGVSMESAGEERGRHDGRKANVLRANTQLPSPTATPTYSSPQSPITPREAQNGQVHDEPSSDSAVSDQADHADPEPAKVPDRTKSGRHRNSSGAKPSHPDRVRRLSANKMQELAAAPDSLPVATIPDRPLPGYPLSAGLAESSGRPSMAEMLEAANSASAFPYGEPLCSDGTNGRLIHSGRPTASPRTLSTPPTSRRKSSSQPPTQPSTARRNSFQPIPRPPPLNLDGSSNFPSATPKTGQASRPDASERRPPSPIPPTIPLPPVSIPTLLQLELAAQRPSPLYIHQSYTSDIPYESSAVKFERLKNFLLLPTYLERTMYFGVLACFDAWLWTFTILPMRFCVALSVLFRWWAYVVGKEARWMTSYVWGGVGRMWQRARRGPPVSRGRNADHNLSSAGEESRSSSRAREIPNGSLANGHLAATGVAAQDGQATRRLDNAKRSSNGAANMPRPTHSKFYHGTPRHRRTKSVPSNLTSFHKADLLQGAVIIFSSVALMNLDASRMYHFIRAQSAVKLYVIYNLIEVGDRLLSALGQDIFECLFSAETLSRNASGRSKILLPFGMFLLALVYNVAHAAVLFYQVITLNVAVNSYSNALLSLLMSNQFVEVKSSVFKRIEKENCFQLACADMVERFQLWIVLIIVAMRNIVEVGGLSVPGSGSDFGMDDIAAKIPLHNTSIIPASFTILPSWLASGEVLSPFVIVIGSEMIVDWIKHAYINKFNNIKPNFYSRILDILCKDYYTNAFVTPSMTRRLGLPLLPLCCLFIRTSVQTYHMFLATHLPSPLPPSTQTSLSVESATPSSPAIAASLNRLDMLIRNALGRAVHGNPYNTTIEGAATTVGPWVSDGLIAGLTMVVVFFIAFLVLLVFKLLLGMALLRYSRNRYARMKAKENAVTTGKAERESFDTKGKRLGGYSQVEVGEDRRRWIFEDDPEGLRKLRAKEQRDTEKAKKEVDLSSVRRYEMIAKRIW